MSVLGKKWVVKYPSLVESLERRARGLDQVHEFHDPYLFSDMEVAVSRIRSALEKGQKIMIFGDYDVDGITGTAILVHTLNSLKANVSYRLPTRAEGYGLNDQVIEDFAAENVDLLITVDCGISCEKQLNLAKEKGIDTIVTDHHTIPEKIPQSPVAILHPKITDNSYPYSELVGAGVALKLAQALTNSINPHLVELAALGTVADLAPLTNENRLIVQRGLETLQNTNSLGLRQLIQTCNVSPETPFDTFTIGYQLAPRLNAAGRIADPLTSLELLLETENQDKAFELSRTLEFLNQRRQNLTAEAIQEAEATIDPSQNIIILKNPQWQTGILGLVAGRLTEKYNRPSIIMQELGNICVASARSIPGFNIIEAISRFSHLLSSYGGHAQAAGFSIKKEFIPEFTAGLQALATQTLQPHDLAPVLEITCEVHHTALDFDLLSRIETLQPFGVSNQKPTFLLRNIRPSTINQVGRDLAHLKFIIPTTHQSFNTIAFNMSEHAQTLKQSPKIDLVFTLEKNHWKNKTSLQLQALDFRPSA